MFDVQQNQSIIRTFFVTLRQYVQCFLLTGIRAYRYILSPLLPPSCRFTPTCSCYAAEAIESHGPVKGIFLALRRILRCHPFCEGGYDPVPPVSSTSCTGRCEGPSTDAQSDKTPQCRMQTGSVLSPYGK